MKKITIGMYVRKGIMAANHKLLNLRNLSKVVSVLFILLALICSVSMMPVVIGSGSTPVLIQCEMFGAITRAYLNARGRASGRGRRRMGRSGRYRRKSRRKSGRRSRRVSNANINVTANTDVIENAPDFTPPGNAGKFDAFGAIKGCDLEAHLDNFAIQLQNEPGAQGYVVAYSKPISGRNYGQELLDHIKEYLISNRGLDPGRITNVDAGAREDLEIQLWIAR